MSKGIKVVGHMGFFGLIAKKYLFLLLCFVMAMFLLTLLGRGGIWQIHHLREERERIKTVTARLKQENRELAEQVERMRKSKSEVERIARTELGLVKKGEIVYQFER